MSGLPKLKPYEAALILAASLAFFVTLPVAYLRTEGGLVNQLYTAFFAGAGIAFLTAVVLFAAGAAVVAALSLARSLRQTA